MMNRWILGMLFLLLSPGITTAQNKVERETLVYAVKDGRELHLDKYVDNSIDHKGKQPVLIYVHGGGFSVGSRINALQIKYGKHFVAKGFVAIAIDYRLGIQPNVPADQPTIMRAVSMASEDLADATAFILSKSEEWNIDTEKIIISGGSAGAITCLTTEYDICSQGKLTTVLPKDFNYAGIISHAGAVIVSQDTLIWEKAPCPILLMHGSEDDLVPFDSYSIEGNLYAGSNYIHDQWNKMNVSHWLYEESGADHIVALKPLQHNFGEIDSFIDKFIMKKQHAMVHTVWSDEPPDSMQDMQDVVPLYIIGWDKTDEEVEAQKK